MSNEKQTAVDWLFLMMNNPNKDQQFANKLLEKAKALEKQQIVEAFSQGYNSGENKALGIPEKSRKQFEDSEQYYSQTYNQ